MAASTGTGLSLPWERLTWPRRTEQKQEVLESPRVLQAVPSSFAAAFILILVEPASLKLVLAKIQYGPREKVGFQVFGYFRFFHET